MNQRQLTVASILVSVLAAPLVPAGSLDPPGPPAPTMTSLAAVEPRIPLGPVGPIEINAGGSYYLTGNLTSASKGITVFADDVTIDLNGFAMSGNGNADGIVIYDAGNVRVHNGLIRGFKRGILVTRSSAGVRIEALSIIDSTLSGIFTVAGAHEVVIERCDLSRNGAHGVHAYGGEHLTILEEPVTIRDNRIYDNGFSGIVVQNVVGIVEDNRIFGNALHGIDIDDARAFVRNNRVHRNVLNGIQIIEGDSATGSAGFVVDNQCFGNGEVGILDLTAAGARIARNLLGFNDLTNLSIGAAGAAAPESPLAAGADGWDNVE